MSREETDEYSDREADVFGHSNEDVLRDSDTANGTTSSAESETNADDGDDRLLDDDPTMSYDDHVAQAASMVKDGSISLEHLNVPSSLDADAEVFRNDIRDVLAQNECQAVTTENVDWQALWREFGFHTPDAHGTVIVSKTQLKEALRVSDQHTEGSLDSKIDGALQDEILVRNWVDGDTLRGYILVGGVA
jgi:hypothetical protein